MTTQQFHIELPRGNDSAIGNGPEDAKIDGVCQEFVTGMQFISRFSGKNNADQAEVIRNNLKLLNNNLKNFAPYRKSLQLAKSKSRPDEGLRWYPLSINSHLQVGLMAVSPGHRVQLRQERRLAQVPVYRLILVLSGRVAISQNLALIGSSAVANTVSGALKAQQSVLITPQMNADVEVVGKTAILLYVQIPQAHLTPGTQAPVLVQTQEPSPTSDQRRRA